MKFSQTENELSGSLSDAERELAFQRYLNALDRGDDFAVDAVLQLAAVDAILCQRIGAANDVLAGELTPQLAPAIASDAQLIEDLARHHLPMAFETPAPRALTFGDVAGELHKLREIPAADVELSARLMGDQTPLPAQISLPELRQIGRALQGQLGLVATESSRFWREFHGAAVRLRKRHSSATRAGNWGHLQPGLAREENPQRLTTTEPEAKADDA